MSFKPIILFLDADRYVSPFDILMAVDVSPDIEFLCYPNVEPEDAKRIVQDAMFPRGPEGAKHTKIFVGGSDFEKASRILEVVKSSIFAPFELAIIFDPHGACTTASAAVAKILNLYEKRFGSIEDKQITILAGTGPVGRIAAKLFAREGANIIVTSRSIKKASKAAEELNKETEKGNVAGLKALLPKELGKAIEGSEIVLSAGAPGVQILSMNVLKGYGKRCKIIADLNGVPPYGIEGLDPKKNGDDFFQGILGIGAMAIGNLKNKIEAELFEKAIKADSGMFSYDCAYKIAKGII